MEISIDDKQGYTLMSLVDRVAGKNVGMEKFIAAGSKCRLVKVTRDIGTSFAKRPDKQRRVRFVRRACSSPLNLPGISHLSSALPTCELQITRRTRAIATSSLASPLPRVVAA